ncbi:MATE family efflux transporter [Pontibacterium sp.]|uniref:MATE family efflux transporter n=1 Tax=Pontibacterium sp. TaxID=2036026 RepID=UPI00351776BD
MAAQPNSSTTITSDMAAGSSRWAEVRQLFIIGWPIIVAQISQTGMGFVDTLMSGHYGAQDLAAIAVGSSIWLPIFLASSGVLMATTPLVAHLVGANRVAKTNSILAQGGLIALILGLLSIVIMHNSAPLLHWMQVAPDLAAKTDAYLRAISWGFPAILLYQVIRSYSEGFGKTRPIMKIAILGLIANIPLNYILIYGKLGLPEMGGVGCGWATAIVMWLTFVAGMFYLLRSPNFCEVDVFHGNRLPRTLALVRFLKLGLPIGMALLIEVSMFAIIALLLADLGEIIVGAHQITISFTGMVFMVPLSISMALTIRIGHQLGAKNPEGARFSASTGAIITICFAMVSATTMVLLAPDIAALYTKNPEIITIAASLISIAALFQFSDAIQVACAGALRGYKDTNVPLLIVFVSFWVVGLPLGYTLARTDFILPAMGPQGFWVALVIGLTISGALLAQRLIWKSGSLCSD